MIQNPRTDDVFDDDLPQTRYKYATPIDPTVGLHYDRGRWFDPTIGRYLNEDPIGYEGTNEYRYVGNDPTNFNFTDPTDLYYNRTRHFDPTPGKFLDEDC